MKGEGGVGGDVEGAVKGKTTALTVLLYGVGEGWGYKAKRVRKGGR